MGSLRPAHPGGPLLPHDLWTAWNTDPWILMPLAVTALIYVAGVRNLWRHAGTGHGIALRHVMSFLGGMFALLVALVSPLDALSEILFSAHMTQHLILVLVAAPLLVMSDLPLAWFWMLPRRRANSLGYTLNRSQSLSRAWQIITGPVIAWLSFAGAMWLWHAPMFYQAALQSEFIHILEHLSYLLTAVLFWWVLLEHTTQKHVRYAMAVPYLFTTALHSGVLGALMSFTSEAWYLYHAALVRPWGFTPLQDQQLAGLIMWLPGGAVFTVLAIRYFALWLGELEERSKWSTHHKTIQTHHEPN